MPLTHYQCFGGPMDGAVVDREKVPATGVYRGGVLLKNEDFTFGTDCFSLPVLDWCADDGFPDFLVRYRLDGGFLRYVDRHRG
jgi:hypothetical protein